MLLEPIPWFMDSNLLPILAALLIGLLAFQELIRRIDRGRVRSAKIAILRRGPVILRVQDLGQPDARKDKSPFNPS